ncbi:hypothetical protein H9P43_001012 [Blastocladiella emersonii ATCC 22665]|nr:hypothetical protein H9P43_001012 [Blastocladiella emersonii ATCC 22665]
MKTIAVMHHPQPMIAPAPRQALAPIRGRALNSQAPANANFHAPIQHRATAAGKATASQPPTKLRRVTRSSSISGATVPLAMGAVQKRAPVPAVPPPIVRQPTPPGVLRSLSVPRQPQPAPAPTAVTPGYDTTGMTTYSSRARSVGPATTRTSRTGRPSERALLDDTASFVQRARRSLSRHQQEKRRRLSASVSFNGSGSENHAPKPHELEIEAAGLLLARPASRGRDSLEDAADLEQPAAKRARDAQLADARQAIVHRLSVSRNAVHPDPAPAPTPDVDPAVRLAAFDYVWADQAASLAFQQSSRDMAAMYAREASLAPIHDYTCGGSGPQAWAWAMRSRMVDWAAQAARYMGADHGDAPGAGDALHVAVRLVDEHLARESVAAPLLPLVAAAALWIAAKMYAPRAPSAAFLADDMLAGSGWTAADVAAAERHLLRRVRFHAARPAPGAFLAHIATVDRRSHESGSGMTAAARIALARFFLDAALVEPGFINVPASARAFAAYLAAAFAISGRQVDSGSGDASTPPGPDSPAWAKLWTAHHVRFANGATVEDLVPLATEMYRAAAERVVSEAPAVVARHSAVVVVGDEEDDLDEDARRTSAEMRARTQDVSGWFARWAQIHRYW